MPDAESAAHVAVTFHPQEWVDTAGEAHEWDRKQLVSAEDREPVTFSVPREDATDASGAVFEDESYGATLLQDHQNAPEWVSDWDGPYLVRTATE